MYLVLLILGVVLALAGAGMVAYGIPINEFGLGNTLIVAGTTAFTGGLILVGLSQVVKQLRRIAERFGATSDIAMPHIEDLSEPAPHSHSEPKPQPAAAAAPAATRIRVPPKPAPRTRAPAPAPEPRPDAAPPIVAAEEEAELQPPPSFVRVTQERIAPEREEAPEEAPRSPAGSRFAEPRVS